MEDTIFIIGGNPSDSSEWSSEQYHDQLLKKVRNACDTGVELQRDGKVNIQILRYKDRECMLFHFINNARDIKAQRPGGYLAFTVGIYDNYKPLSEVHKILKKACEDASKVFFTSQSSSIYKISSFEEVDADCRSLEKSVREDIGKLADLGKISVPTSIDSKEPISKFNISDIDNPLVKQVLSERGEVWVSSEYESLAEIEQENKIKDIEGRKQQKQKERDLRTDIDNLEKEKSKKQEELNYLDTEIEKRQEKLNTLGNGQDLFKKIPVSLVGIIILLLVLYGIVQINSVKKQLLQGNTSEYSSPTDYGQLNTLSLKADTILSIMYDMIDPNVDMIDVKQDVQGRPKDCSELSSNGIFILTALSNKQPITHGTGTFVCETQGCSIEDNTGKSCTLITGDLNNIPEVTISYVYRGEKYSRKIPVKNK